MQETDAVNFYQRVVEGKKQSRSIDLEHADGYVLADVQMHPVDKKKLGEVIEQLPESIFEAAEEADGDIEQAEEEVDGDMSAVTEGTVAAFEDLLHDSLQHEELTTTQMRAIVNELSFEMLFELGSECINMSVEETGEIRDFHEQD
jgi:hypothetical protein